ncbi:MAG: PQQ-binding-like beta-propeller repeat protein, partial [Planctomycetota bacterium]
MVTMRSVTWVLAIGLSAAAAAAGPDAGNTGLGYRGDGTCVAEDANPPVTWDERTGENILWSADLPQWGLGAPAVVDDRVVVVCEPYGEHYFPMVLCFDADTGEKLWQREMAHIELLPDGPQPQAVAQAWREFVDGDRLLYRSAYEYHQAEDKEAAKERLAELGLTTEGKGQVRG